MSEKDKDEQIKDLQQSNQILENNLNKIKELHNHEVIQKDIELTPEEIIIDAMVSRQETKIANAKAKIKVLTKAPEVLGWLEVTLDDTEIQFLWDCIREGEKVRENYKKKISWDYK